LLLSSQRNVIGLKRNNNEKEEKKYAR